MVTLDNARRNLRTAAGNVAARLGVDPAALTYDERRAYNSALAAEILRYPASFTSEILTIAGNVRDQGALTQESGWGDFAADVTAAAAVASVPVLGDFTNKLLWILALGVAVWAAVQAFRSPPRGPATA